MLTLVMTPFVALGTLVGPVLLYGPAFRGAVLPAEIIIIGLSIEGAAAVSSAYLLGVGRPGLNSVGMGVGAFITVTLDLILIPKYGALGGAITSAVTYLATTITLTYIGYRVARTTQPSLFDSTGRDRDGSARLHIDREPAAALRPDTAVRRVVDAVTAFVALVIVSPLLVAAAVAVKATSRGPALYKQVRAGKSGQMFTMLKFRSMVSDDEQTGPLVTERADPRITRLGTVLRATKIDELPQLFNVLKGDMTLIGPRPEVPRFLGWYDPEELGILRVRPGLTGPGQIFYTESQSSEEAASGDPEEHYVTSQLHPKLGVDLDYLRRRGLWFDLTILLRTVAVMCHTSRRTPMPSVAHSHAE